MRTQRGMSFIGFIIVAIVVVSVALIAIKAFPAYTEYFSVKKAIDNLVREQSGASPAAIRESFSRQAEIGYITVVKPTDLVILESAGVTKVSVAYEQVVPLFANVSLLFNFEYAKSSGGGNSP